MLTSKRLFVWVIIPFMLVGCQSMTKQDVGTVTGGLAGGLIGSRFGGGSGQIAATLGGTLLGAYLGNRIGASMDEVDKMKMANALETTRTSQVTQWKNPDNGNTYAVEPTRTYTRNDGQPCREFQQTVTIGGKQQQAYGTACRDASGDWRIVEKR